MPHGEYPEADQGKCRSCGFLSKHARIPIALPSPRFFEMEHSEREKPDWIRQHVVDSGILADTEPMCFLGKINLAQILLVEGDAKLVEAIKADRKCDGWYPYMPGLSPQEHYETMNLKAFHEALESEREMRERSYRRQDRYFVIASLIIGLAQIIAAVILSYHESYVDKILRGILEGGK
jgi:hypothetical protein